jgi:hypothetical protein
MWHHTPSAADPNLVAQGIENLTQRVWFHPATPPRSPLNNARARSRQVHSQYLNTSNMAAHFSLAYVQSGRRRASLSWTSVEEGMAPAGCGICRAIWVREAQTLTVFESFGLETAVLHRVLGLAFGMLLLAVYRAYADCAKPDAG